MSLPRHPKKISILNNAVDKDGRGYMGFQTILNLKSKVNLSWIQVQKSRPITSTFAEGSSPLLL